MALKKALIQCDDEHRGSTTVRAFVKKLYKMKLNIPMPTLNFYINTLMEKEGSDQGLDGNKFDLNAKISFQKL